MTLKRSYVAELEYTIKTVLLPVYNSYYEEKGQKAPLDKLQLDFLKEVVSSRKECALFKPKNMVLK